MSAGTYIVKAGDKFYIGSSSRLSSRKSDHLTRLKRQIHHNKRLQSAFDATQSASFISIQFLHIKPGEDKSEFRSRLRDAEQELLDYHAGNPDLCNESLTARFPDHNCEFRKLPVSPETRAKMSLAQRGKTLSDQAKAKMAKAKTGANNPKAREIRINCPDGSIALFHTVTDMAKFFNVSQQTADLWVRGVCAWPGTGRRNKRANAWIADYSIAK